MIELSQTFSVILKTFTEVENEMNSVERVCHYANNLNQEASYKKSEFKPAPEWPNQGSIKFENVSLKYREGLPLVLRKLNLNVKSGEK